LEGEGIGTIDRPVIDVMGLARVETTGTVLLHHTLR